MSYKAKIGETIIHYTTMVDSLGNAVSLSGTVTASAKVAGGSVVSCVAELVSGQVGVVKVTVPASVTGSGSVGDKVEFDAKIVDGSDVYFTDTVEYELENSITPP